MNMSPTMERPWVRALVTTGLLKCLPWQARVLPQHLLAPQGAQFGLAGRRRVGIDVLGVEGRELVLDALQEHRPALFRGDADGGVELMGLLLGFGGLGQDPLGEEEVLPEVRKHLQDMGVVLGKLFVQFCGQWVHHFLREGMKCFVPCSRKRKRSGSIRGTAKDFLPGRQVRI